MKRSLPLLTLAALGAAAYAPLPSMAQTDVQLYIGTAPPAPLYERMPGARRGHVWVPGYWAWNGRRHYWMPGSYIVERPGYVYAAPVWQQRGGRWYMQQGGWAVQRGGPHYAHRDGGRQHAYRDGYYDRHDRNDRRQAVRGRDRDRDGIPDRHDRDRDGDGRRNSRDSSPDNPYRR